MRNCFLLLIIFLSLSLFELAFSSSLEEKRQSFVQNIEKLIKKDLTLPSNTETLVSSTKTDITILFQGAKLSEINSLQKKYRFSNEVATQIKAAQYLSTSNIYSKIEERIQTKVGEFRETIGSAFREGDSIYFAIIRGMSKATLREKYEKVCHEECKWILFIKSCKTVCDDVITSYTPEDINKIKQYIEYYSAQVLLNHVEVLKSDGYQTYITDGNGIYSEDGKYVMFITDFGDLAIGPSRDVSTVAPLMKMELLDDGTRVYNDESGSRSGGSRTEGSRNTTSGSTTSSRSSSTRNLAERTSGSVTGRNATRTGGTSRGSTTVRNMTVVSRSYTGNAEEVIRTKCYKEKIMGISFNFCFDYVDGNFQMFHFIGKGVDGAQTKAQVLDRMYEGRKKGDYYLIILNDGNMLIYNGNNIIWQSYTANKGQGPFNLKVTNDRYLILEDSTGKILYKSGTIEEYYLMKRCDCKDYHDITIGPLSLSCTLEGQWKTYPNALPDTDMKQIYQCYIPSNLRGNNPHYISSDPNCEGFSLKANMGWIYTTPISGTEPLYRCLMDGDHFVSSLSSCEGAKNEFLIGYAFPE